MEVAMGRVTSRRPVVRVVDGRGTRRVDTLVVEEPLEIRVGGPVLTTTMRTPGDDFDLVTGFLLTEGVVRRSADIATMRYCAGTDETGRNTYNVIDVTLAAGVSPPAPGAFRATYTSSACGVCGKASIDALRTISAYDVRLDAVRLSPAVVTALPQRLRAAQRLFDRTGGLHAAGLFTAAGELLCVREDVGRHNAVDKVLGWATREDRLPLAGHVLQVSGRASFELTQKAAMAGVPVLSAVSAPSSLAVDLAVELGMTLAGFVRGDTMNVYAGSERITAGRQEERP
jgi:FdhD protein